MYTITFNERKVEEIFGPFGLDIDINEAGEICGVEIHYTDGWPKYIREKFFIQDRRKPGDGISYLFGNNGLYVSTGPISQIETTLLGEYILEVGADGSVVSLKFSIEKNPEYFDREIRGFLGSKEDKNIYYLKT